VWEEPAVRASERGAGSSASIARAPPERERERSVAAHGEKPVHSIFAEGPMEPRALDVIAAVATAPGEGAIGIIRVSGAGSIALVDRVFRGGRELTGAPGYTIHHGRVVGSGGEELDEVLASVFRAPHSYTGEEAVELSCHGGRVVTCAVLAAVLGAGARPAEPGEFTRRAFVNGKMDLTQAEAVADLIAARSERARAVSVAQLEGKLGARVRGLRERLLSLCALLELSLDFSEEGLDLLSRQEIAQQIAGVSEIVAGMIRSYAIGSLAREGVSVVLAGRPNAGKSSLFNLLLEEERSIVTPVPGTTRDAIEESVTLGGILFRLTDTAGIRGSSDLVEAEGVERAKARVRAAEVILLVEDLASGVEASEIEGVLSGLLTRQHLVVALNKCDLVADSVRREEDVAARFAGRGARLVRTSARTGEGMEELRRALLDSVIAESGETPEGMVVTSLRHLEALERGRGMLASALAGLSEGRTNEFISLDVREAVAALGEITGEVTSEEILQGIFARFCIGK
jgi:tRNA modification GTPase